MTRAECPTVRPCPRITCKWHLAIDGSLTESCAIDVADRGPHLLREIGEILGITRERVRQIESNAIAKLRQRIE